MKLKKLLGIFFFLTLITTTVFGSIAENPRQGFDGIFTGLHQGVTLSKAATAPGLSACFLESSRQVFLLGQGGNALGKLTKEMKSQAEIIAKGDRIQKVEELIQKWGGKVKDWVKKKTWDSAGNELHYYEGPNGIIKGLKSAGTPDPF